VEWLPILRDFGLPTVLVLFFVASSHLREKRMSERLDKVEDEIVTHLTGVIAANTVAQQENTAMQKQVITTLSRLETDCAARMAAHVAEGRT